MLIFIFAFSLLANETMTGKICTSEVANKEWRRTKRKMKRTGSWDDLRNKGIVFTKTGNKRQIVVNEPDELTVQDLKRAGFRCTWTNL